MSGFAYRLRAPETPALGLIVLRVDETVEPEFRHSIPPNKARLYVSRIPSGDDLTPDSIAAMESGLKTAAGLLPEAAGFDVVGYACTSASARIGADRVHKMIRAGVATKAVTDPLSAALAYIRDLGLSRVGIVSPYVDSVAAPLRDAFCAAGIEVPDMLSFGEKTEARVARIDPASIRDAARALAGRAALDGLFLSCTNLRTQMILGPLQGELGLPVLSSNQVLAWHMSKIAGISQGPGRLDIPPAVYM